MNARPAFLVALVLAAVAGPLVAWWSAGTDSMDRLEARLLAEARADLATEELRRALRAAELLEDLRASESERPWYHYQDYYNDPGALADGLALFPSPIAADARPPLIAAFASLSDGEPPWESGWSALGAGDPSLLERAASAIATAAQIRRLPVESYEQNVSFGKGGERRVRVSPVPAAPPVDVEVQSFRWMRLQTADGPGLAAVRRIETPDGRRVQAFAIDRTALETALATSLAQSARVRIVASSPSRTASTPIPVENCSWHVVLVDDSLSKGAGERSALLRSRFERTLLLGGSLALLGALAAGLLLAQAGRIARQRATFAAAAAHELRTPLASLRLQAELLEQQTAGGAAGERASRIVGETSRLSRVVSNILGATRLERGGIATNVIEGDLAASVARIIAEQRRALGARGLEVALSGADVPLAARFDPEALAHVLGNLLDNAERHARGRPGRRAEVSLGRGDDGAPRILVTDTGPGVHPELRASLFEPYVRSSDPSRGGLGLGLPIARALCRAMGGDLRHHEPEPGRGTGAAFEITLPAL